MKRSLLIAAAVMVLCVGSANAVDFITGTSTATQVVDPGPTFGWYQYDMNISWDFSTAGMGAGLSHWDVLLALCADPAVQVVFPDPAGTSTSENLPADPFAVNWFAEFLPEGDPIIVPPITDPIIKYDQVPDQLEEAGTVGFGTFSFIINSAPEANQVHSNVLVGKAGSTTQVFGDLTGDYPDCLPIPEPASISLLLIGLAIIGSRKSRRA